MILTNCAACAAPLAQDHKKRCSRCKTRYCNEACQREHWERGGHEALCRRIKRAGGAEQINADKKYKEAVAVAAKACADDTKGQTCYICTQALHWKTKEGLMRMCACRGTAGFAHVSCLAEQAKILIAEAEENNLDWEAKNPRFRRWHTCSLCEQGYHGVMACALGWGCWKTYLGRPETDQLRGMAMNVLGNGLNNAKHWEDALTVQEAELSMLRRHGAPADVILYTQANLANTYQKLRRLEEARSMERDVYSGLLRLNGEEHPHTLQAANNYAASLIKLERYEEARSLLRTMLPVARRVLGESNDLTLGLRTNYAQSLYFDAAATLNDLREAVTTLADTERIARRVFGGAHPTTTGVAYDLREARAALRARERGDVDVESIREAVAAMTAEEARALLSALETPPTTT